MLNTFLVADARNSRRGFPRDLSDLRADNRFNVRMEVSSDIGTITSNYTGVSYQELRALAGDNDCRMYIQVIGGDLL